MQPNSNLYRYAQRDTSCCPTEEDDGPDCLFGNRTRFMVLILATLCLSAILGNVLTFNFTIICVTSTAKSSDPLMGINGTRLAITDNINREVFNYSPLIKSMLFAAVPIGALVAFAPVTWLLQNIGSRSVFGLLGFVSAISTALVPTAARAGEHYLLGVHTIQGVGLAACLPVMVSVTAHWASLKQNGIFIAMLSSFLQIAPIVTMPVAGSLCVSPFGWPAVYYLNAFVTVVLFSIFVFYFRDAPTEHSFIGAAELHKVEQGKVDDDIKKIPYLAIMKTPAVWAVWVAAFANVFGTQMLLQFTPIYLNKVLGFPIATAGLAAALPPLAQLLVKLFAGMTSRQISCMPESVKVRIYNTLALCGTGTFFIALAFVPTSDPVLSLLLLIAAASMIGFNLGGFFKSATLLARHHSHFILGNISRMHCFAWMIVPFVVDVVAPTDSAREWQNVFLLHAGILFAANVFFCIFARGKAASWTNEAFMDSNLAEFQHRNAALASHTPSLWNVMVY